MKKVKPFVWINRTQNQYKTEMKTEPKNIEELKKLVQRYETITLKEVETAVKHHSNNVILAARSLTGFGSLDTCTLCLKGRVFDALLDLYTCQGCVYYNPDKCGEPGSDKTFCSQDEHTKTYQDIMWANDANELFEAYKARALHLSKYYSQYLKDPK